jgi:hypothetical protein
MPCPYCQQCGRVPFRVRRVSSSEPEVPVALSAASAVGYGRCLPGAGEVAPLWSSNAVRRTFRPLQGRCSEVSGRIHACMSACLLACARMASPSAPPASLFLRHRKFFVTGPLVPISSFSPHYFAVLNRFSRNLSCIRTRLSAPSHATGGLCQSLVEVTITGKDSDVVKSIESFQKQAAPGIPEKASYP